MNFTQDLTTPWSFWTKVLFRFIFLYATTYIFLMFGSRLFEGLFVWIGENILHTEGKLEYFMTGSGDTTMAYISLVFQIFLMVLGSIIWTAIDRKRVSYNTLFYWLSVLIRMFLIFFMFTYGFVKIYKTQFAGPSLMRLLQPVGDMSPMGLAWTYMAQSEGFNIFVGAMEVIGGLLLIPRRTVTLGAFITMGVMFHVAMMNLFYDIPVKLFSINLFVLAAILFFKDIKRFTNVFIKNKDAMAVNYYTPVVDKVYHKVIFWFKLVCTVGLVAIMCFQGYSRERNFGDKREKPEFYGIWEVTHFVKNSDTLPPLITLNDRWRYLVIDQKNYANVKMINDSINYYSFKLDSNLTKVSIRKRNDTTVTNNFTIQKKDSLLTLSGILDSDTLLIKCKSRDLSKIRLINRGFHWVNEYPYNR